MTQFHHSVANGFPIVNQHQYDAAKDAILDLLGWGVPPEYLVDCGLTRELVFHVFNELNLRLPQNLDTTGIVPYKPDLPTFLERQNSAALMPPPPPPQGNRSSQAHPSLPSKPHLQSLDLASNTIIFPYNVTPTSQPQVFTGTDLLEDLPSMSNGTPVSEADIQKYEKIALNMHNLHAMEEQRRRELRARKAVIASRKSKQLPSTTSTTSSASLLQSNGNEITSGNEDVDMTVLTETVDDFLKSIEPTSASSKADDDNGVSDVPSKSQSVDDMDVDEIPGLGSTHLSNQSSRGSPEPWSRNVIHQSPTPVSPAFSTFSSNSKTEPECPPSSTESMTTTFTQDSVHEPDSIETQGLQRRGTKRPVAADFVDFDNGARPHSNGGHSNGAHSRPRHRPGGFASVSGMRRCVIDLSDSEGEGEGETSAEAWTHRSTYSSPIPTRPSLNTHSTSGGWATPPIPAATPSNNTASITPTGTMSPAALMEKEIEIRKMKEMIAQREQRRQNKLAAVSDFR